MKIKTLVISMPKIKEILHAEKHGKMLGFSIALIQVKCPGGGSIKGGGGGGTSLHKLCRNVPPKRLWFLV